MEAKVPENAHWHPWFPATSLISGISCKSNSLVLVAVPRLIHLHCVYCHETAISDAHSRRRQTHGPAGSPNILLLALTSPTLFLCARDSRLTTGWLPLEDLEPAASTTTVGAIGSQILVSDRPCGGAPAVRHPHPREPSCHTGDCWTLSRKRITGPKKRARQPPFRCGTARAGLGLLQAVVRRLVQIVSTGTPRASSSHHPARDTGEIPSHYAPRTALRYLRPDSAMQRHAVRTLG